MQALCVLIVEDEPLIRLITAEEFTEAGFDVCDVESGDRAARLIKDATLAFTLLVTDIHMPGERDGLEVARLMHRHHPNVPVIYTTGRPDVLDDIGPLGENEAVVAKPFAPSELLRVARFLLGKEDAHDRKP